MIYLRGPPFKTVSESSTNVKKTVLKVLSKGIEANISVNSKTERKGIKWLSKLFERTQGTFKTCAKNKPYRIAKRMLLSFKKLCRSILEDAF